jgi:hypothetical protein
MRQPFARPQSRPRAGQIDVLARYHEGSSVEGADAVKLTSEGSARSKTDLVTKDQVLSKLLVTTLS